MQHLPAACRSPEYEFTFLRQCLASRNRLPAIAADVSASLPGACAAAANAPGHAASPPGRCAPIWRDRTNVPRSRQYPARAALAIPRRHPTVHCT